MPPVAFSSKQHGSIVCDTCGAKTTGMFNNPITTAEYAESFFVYTAGPPEVVKCKMCASA